MPTTTTDMSRRGRRLLPAAVFLCVAGAHVWMIWMAPTALSFSVRHIHTDNAVILLMGKHMREKGEFPIFYYGQDWFGSLSAMVHAGVFLVLGGIPPWSIHVAPLLFFLGFCLVLYRLTRDTLGPGVALWALAWNIATPVRLAEYAVMPHGGYVEGLMLGTLLLWLAVRLVMARGTRRQNGYYALLGFVGGVAWWTSPLVVYQILASGSLRGDAGAAGRRPERRAPVAAGLLPGRGALLLLLRRRSLLERPEPGRRLRPRQRSRGAVRCSSPSVCRSTWTGRSSSRSSPSRTASPPSSMAARRWPSCGISADRSAPSPP